MAKKSSDNLLPMILVGVLLTAAVLLRPRWGGAVDQTAQPLPPLATAAWLNSDGAPKLDGKIVVMDAWFTTCPPCLQSLPKLARLHEKYAGDSRVQFIGVTFEPEENLPQIQAVVDRIDGFTWPVAYAAQRQLDMLDIHMFPTLVVFDQSGTSVWRGHDLGGLEAQIDSML
ncbi:thiol-disulfide oxidoreductase [Posidoniimonas polymericola]|uniref:Thiol-disulfide oxidoreductase n=2 Tax=Posidoniimonas polymericola TaxID=2528002 RepID=A0A5C5YHW0_9BACT|nr:thiol-disulfide oxidoreductase [Posidoniimonas polymericola]